MANRINWIALPGGRHDENAGRTRLTLFASLRIGEPPDCPEIVDWPATLSSLEFRVLIDGEDPGRFLEADGTLHRLAAVAPSSPAWRQALGHVIERPALRSARRAQADAALLADPGRLLSFDARGIADDLDGLYRSAVRRQAAAITAAGAAAGRLGAFDSRSAAASSLRGFSASANTRVFDQFYRPVPTGVLQADREPLDFNQTLALVSQYPFLMRLFGLAVDFELELPAARIPASGRIRIEPVAPPECPSASAWTAFQSAARGDSVLFTARPRNADAYRDGFLFLGAGSRYALLQEDVEGQTMKLQSMSQHLALGADNDVGDAGAELPAQRTVGLTFIQSGRAAALAANTRNALSILASAEAAADNGGVAEETFFLEDVSQAVRPDVKRDDREFLSLCSREVDFRIGTDSTAEQIEGVADEGLVPGAVTQPDTEARVHEALFRFDGYGLCVDLPFATADGESAADTNTDTKGLRIEAVPRPLESSLPPLRFGAEYRFAVRVVDVAGGGLSLADTRRLLDDGAPAVAGALSESVRFVRREPIGSPVLIPTAPLGAGESDDLIAVRTDHRGHSDGSARHLLPPAVAAEVAERSGVLDGMSTDEVFDLLDARDRRLDEETYPAGRFAEVPYLADPLARHARLEFVGLPGQTEPLVLVVPFQKQGWPRANGILVELRAGYAMPAVTESGRPRVRIELPPGHRATLIVQAIPDADDLPTTFLAQYGFDDDPAFTAHPALAPAREITLVHAVERPLAAPAFTNPEPLPRGANDTSVQLDDQLAVDVASTGRLTCYARWENPVDSPPPNREAPSAPPGRVARSAEAFSFPLARDLEHVLLAQGGVDHNGDIIPNRHRLGTTGHRSVEYRLAAETRFPVYFPGSELENQRRESSPVTVDVPNAARPSALSIRHVIPLFDWRGDEHGLGHDRGWPFEETKPVVERRRLGRRLRIYLERPCLLSGFEEQLGVVLWPAPLAELAAEETGCLRKAVSQWALDPIAESATLPDGPFPRHFPLAATVLHGIELEEIPELAQAGDPEAERECAIEPGRLPNRVTVAGHRLRFDAAADAWYADVEIDSGDAYFPFVRLGLVRFQPISQPGAHASALSFAEFAQLAPDRFLTLSYKDTPRPEIEVSLVGPGYEPQPDGRPGAIIDVRLEQPRHRRSDVGWWPVGDIVALKRTRLPGDRMAWSGTIRVPPGADDDLRLTVREFERFRDPGTGRVRRRLVYADMVPVHGERRWYD